MSTESAIPSSLNPLESWDKNKTYFSPSGENILIYINGKWTQYVRADAVSEIIEKTTIQIFDRFKEMSAITRTIK